MLEGVLKAERALQAALAAARVSILGMLEGVLKGGTATVYHDAVGSFNPWYVGGGVKRVKKSGVAYEAVSFNPWYVGGGVKRVKKSGVAYEAVSFNPWYVGGGVKSSTHPIEHVSYSQFQSLVCWRGC